MNQVFLITDGTYSDYHIVAACSTREKAESALDKLKEHSSDYQDADIETYDLDAPEEGYNQGLKHWYISMEYDGTATRWDVTDKPEYPLRVYTSPYGSRRQYVEGWVLAEDRKHAIKIANEFRAQAIANGTLFKETP